MKVLMVASTYPTSNTDPTPGFVRDLAKAAASRCTVQVLAPRVPRDDDDDQPVPVRRFAYFPRRFETLADGAMLENLKAHRWRWLQVPFFFIAEIIAMRRAVRSFRPDVVHLHWLVPQGVAGLVGIPRSVPIVVTTLGGDVYALRDRLSMALKRAVCRRAAAMTTQNAVMRDQLLALGAAAATTHVKPLGADLASIRASAESERREHGLVVFVGRLAEKKGVDVLIDAVDGLRSTLDVRAEIFGDGELRAQLESRAKGKPIVFRGGASRDEVGRAFGRAAVVALPSIQARSGDQEGLPLTLLEAMGAGCAVVASDLDGIRDVVDDGRNGLLCPPGDADALAKRLAELVTDPAAARRLGDAAEITASRFDAQLVGEHFVDMYAELAEGRCP